MNRFLTVAAGLALSVTTLVSTAKALPPIMDRVPANAAIVVVIPSIEGLEKDMNSVLQLVGQPPMVRADDLLSGSGMEGLSKKGSLALVVLESPDIESGEEPPMVAIFQADDYAAFTKGMTTSKDGELDKGVVNGEDVWMKSIGGNYVVAGPKKEHVSAFDGKGGGGERHKKFYGSRADRMTDKADVAVFFDVARLKPLVDQGMAGVEQQMADLAAMTGNPGNAESFKWVKEHIIADTTAGAASLSIDAQGVSLDFACVAKEGSAFAKALDTTGKAHSLLGKLPGGPYLFAYAMDMSNKNWRELFKSMPQAEGADGMGALGALAGSDPEALKDATGMSMVIGVPPGGIMSGVLTRATGYVQTSTPEKVIAFYRDELPKALEKDELGKMEYKSAVKEIEGKKVDSFTLTLTPDEGMQGMGQQVITGLFGMSGGPTAYIAAVDGGVVSTLSQSTEMMTAAIKATKGENTFTSDKTLGAVAEKLPAGRMIEGYVGVKDLLDVLLKMAPMMGAPEVKVKIPEKLPPVAGGVAIGDGQAQATFYIPSDVFKTGGEIFNAFNNPPVEEGGDEGGDGMKKDGEPAPQDDKKDKPKF